MLRTCTTSTDTALLGLGSYKAAAKITTTSDDTVIQSFLDRATALIESYVGYPLRRGVYYETIPGYGANELRVSRTPITEIESITYQTETVDPDSYTISGDGLIERELGWPWTGGVQYDLQPHYSPNSELKSYTVVYEAGYCTNGSTESGWLTTGLLVPPDLEAAVTLATNFLYQSAGRDLTVRSKKIGDLAVEYQEQKSGVVESPSAGLPQDVKGLLSHYRRF